MGVPPEGGDWSDKQPLAACGFKLRSRLELRIVKPLADPAEILQVGFATLQLRRVAQHRQ
jgi:hypothetical protein